MRTKYTFFFFYLKIVIFHDFLYTSKKIRSLKKPLQCDFPFGFSSSLLKTTKWKKKTDKNILSSIKNSVQNWNGKNFKNYFVLISHFER